MQIHNYWVMKPGRKDFPLEELAKMLESQGLYNHQTVAIDEEDAFF